MFSYRTIEEKAEEWGVSLRNVQNMCKQGKIAGAIKRGGVWFIPEDAINPAKADERPFMFTGTKKLIFEKAIELFSQMPYESVSIKDIAEQVGIRQSTVYNHFKSKQELLDTIYDFFCYYFVADRPSLQDLEKVIAHGSILDIFNGFTYTFNPEYDALLIAGIKIVFQRAFLDERAREIFRVVVMKSGHEFVEEVFNRAVAVGRIAPCDTHTLSLITNMTRIMILIYWLTELKKEDFGKYLEDEQQVFHFAIHMIEDLGTDGVCLDRT